MRRILSTCIAVFVALFYVSGQDNFYHPTDGWPYIFSSFQSGTIIFEEGYSDLNAEINICVANGHMHYIDKGIILESETKGVVGAEAGGKKYVAFDEQMFEILASNDNGYVCSLTEIDILSMGKTDIGFGMTSSTYAASTVDLTAVSGIGEGIVHAKVAEAALKQDEGTVLPLKETVYIIVGKQKIEATKSALQGLVGKDNANDFLKANKVKWNKPETLLPVVDFIAENN